MRLRIALAAAAVALACRHPKQARPPAPSPEPPSQHGARTPPGRPRVPSSPEGLLADDAVAQLQRALARRGYLGEHREGDLDAATSAALRRFQRDEGLATTGFPDRETLQKLGVDPEHAYRRARKPPRERR
jgi:peptidoglycan hydrolase-like protein with peptidoglycan-binding domain